MSPFLRRPTSRCLVALLAAAALLVSAVGTARASSSIQVILSATGFSTPQGPAGFWIWSQPDNNNNHGINGAGSIYFYALLPAEHPVEVSDVTVSGSSLSETVTSKDGLITCPSFTGTETAPGKGLVSFTCFVTTSNGTITVTATNIPSEVHIGG